MVVTGCRRQVALLSPSSLPPPPPRRSARDFRYNFYFFLHFFLSSSDCSPAVSLRWSSVRCCLLSLSVVCRPVLASYVLFVFFFRLFFSAHLCFFPAATVCCVPKKHASRVDVPKRFSRTLLISEFFFTKIHTLIFFPIP